MARVLYSKASSQNRLLSIKTALELKVIAVSKNEFYFFMVFNRLKAIVDATVATKECTN